MTWRRGIVVMVMTLAIFGGCARDRDVAYRVTVPQAQFEADLDTCESDVAAARATGGAEGFLIGAMIGAANGAIIGAESGGADTGAAVGAGVGALIGFFKGMAYADRGSISDCMRAKGYRRT